MDPTARILRLLSLLQTYRHWPGEELSDRLGVSPRTLRRDVDRLRELGYPVDTTRAVGGPVDSRPGEPDAATGRATRPTAASRARAP
ncbi:MAG TPA: helix-turn-helix domain-containing protein, partial [Mycobacteriales bacterium]|nr:helix-turn-helix domain-containing protein [Mycobacteriales bacterium]